jgi:hypothetical protein
MSSEGHIGMMGANRVNIMNFVSHIPDNMKVINEDAFTGRAHQITHSVMGMPKKGKKTWAEEGKQQPAN